MIRVSILSLAAMAAICAPAAHASTTCLDAAIMLRDVAVEDASGRWEGQDVLIEDGVITAMGGELELDAPIAEWALSGHTVRPAQETGIIVRVSARAPQADPAPVYLMPGEAADLDIFGHDGQTIAQLRDGQPAGQCFSG
ncbi:hypothetical protein [Maricaulis sp.]|uniref:hypothetical protein n=1 Tax=Maricaulis sp. TaxID=1486257 RepID=UPI0026378353|nr:hypothetical protein [Maricaulis sp.]